MATVGSSVVASKVIGASIEPFLGTALRHALALPVLLALCWRMRLSWPRPDRHDLLLLAAQAAAGSVGYCVLLIAGTRLTSAADAGIVVGTLPAMAALFSVAVLGERTSLRMGVAIALATGGVCLLAISGDASGAGPRPGGGLSQRAAGALLVLAAVACKAVFILGQKRLSRPIHPVLMSTCMCAGGLLLSALPAAGMAMVQPSHFTTASLAALAWYAWVPTVLGFLLWYAGAARSSGAQAALSTVWLPVTALLLSALWLGETITGGQWAAAGAVIVAVALASRP